MSSSSSSEDFDDEERNNALKEALQCNFIKEIINHVQDDKKCKSQVVTNEVKTLSTFEDNIAKILTKRLDNHIEEVSNKLPTCYIKSFKKCGIQLFTSSRVISDSDLIQSHKRFTEHRKRRDKSDNIIDDVYKTHALQAAVSPEWVISTDNTKYWIDNKKPRIINMKILKRRDTAFHCLVVNDEL